ncbi:hypothetical protein AOL_s00043g28 [Orbilia oligospora ATCC 24927]|uniref:Efficient mitochondria targeting-associated protein 19 n=1 Tax=Arthrobotrys oligospora (strain ATCC 24927 / CBS 115.81 / DSM 1491) TaxID=756982 RepID=G1X2V5_ARTOA|nr:hypothetical protein AOL_s00043g28 [Orbilia oligospora ATCC 24927]EGX52534.1 hypothetical protein AOL_s00043g28 [Orbilia oligospora ATCC 24927]
MAKPISKRPLDFFYRSVFSLILIIAIVADCSPLYPEALRPEFVNQMHKFQFETFKDPFFNPKIHRPWFESLVGLELFVLVPLNAWLLWGWTVDHPLVPVNMIVYAYHMFVTTIPCLAEMYHEFSRGALSGTEVSILFSMYGPFVALRRLIRFSPSEWPQVH